MNEIPLTTVLGGGSIILTLLFFVFRGEGIDKLKKIFGKGQDELKQKIENLELKEAAKIIEVKEAEKKVKEVKKRAINIIKEAKKEVEETGKLDNTEKLLEELDKW